MSYRSYDAVNCNDLDVEALREAIEDAWTIVAVDAAKEYPYAVVYTVNREATCPDAFVDEHAVFRWQHPEQTREVVDMIADWDAASVQVVLEPSGSYLDGLIERVQALEEVELRQLRGKKTRDSKENFDNAPSMHDAKAADVMARIHLGGGSRPWRKRDQRERQLKVALKDVDRLKDERKRTRGRLEAELSRHWPELSKQLPLRSTTLLKLLAEYGSPRAVASHPEEAKALIERVSRGQIGEARQNKLIEKARASIGASIYPEERRYLQRLAERLLELKDEIRQAEARLETLQEDDEVAERLAEMGGPLVAAALIGEVGDPTDFKAAAAYEKAAGLNLVEDTSGHEGQHTEEDDTPRMRISKRGSSRARKQLYLTTQRWIQWCPYAKAWYQHKIAQHAGCDGARKLSLVALMRKLIGALYHVGRGADYEPEKLFDVERLVERGYPPEEM